MASPPVIDIDQLLLPLAGSDPCGSDLRHDPIYSEIQEARKESSRDPLASTVVEPDWDMVIRLTSDVLKNRSKDLQVAVWLLEALARSRGFAGARDGFCLLKGLLENYWLQLFPRPYEDPDDPPSPHERMRSNLDIRLAKLKGFADSTSGIKLPNRLRELRLLSTTDELGQPYSWMYWNARNIPPRQPNEEEEPFVRRKEEAETKKRAFEDAAAATPLASVVATREDILAAKDRLQELDTTVNRLLEDSLRELYAEHPDADRQIRNASMELGVSTSELRKSLDECDALLRRIVKEKGGDASAGPELAASEPSETETVAASHNGSSAANGAHGPIKSRDDAFRRLAEVSEFLRRSEPQSPVPLLIDRAICWGRMPFHELLEEMIKDENTRGQVSELLGIKPKPQQ